MAEQKIHHRGTETQRDPDCDLGLPNIVIPAKAGIHLADNALVDGWIPAFAGMTILRVLMV